MSPVFCTELWTRKKEICLPHSSFIKKQTKAKTTFVWGPRIRKFWEASFYLFLFLRILYMHIVCFDHIGPLFLPHNFSPTHPQPLLFTPNIHVLFHLNPMSPLSAAHTYVHGYRAIYWSWLASQEPCLWEKLILSPLAAINCQELSMSANYHLVYNPVLKK